MKNGQSDAGVVNEASAVILAEVTRGKLVESVHRGSVVVAEVNGQFAAAAGDPERIIFFRSSAKPFQAIPLIASGAADAFDFSTEELALACSSHDATPMHQRGVVRMLAKIGLDDDALRCGISPPADEEEAARITLGLKARSQIQCECSGEHAGMLAACRHLGYSLDDNVAPDHPVQQHIRTIVARVTPGAVQVSPKRGHPQHRPPRRTEPHRARHLGGGPPQEGHVQEQRLCPRCGHAGGEQPEQGRHIEKTPARASCALFHWLGFYDRPAAGNCPRLRSLALAGGEATLARTGSTPMQQHL